MKIEAMYLYPVKSVGGIAIDSAEITPTGSLKGDREWIVVNDAGEMRWQGDIPQLTLLSADYGGGVLGLSNKAGERVAVPADHDGARRVVTQYGFDFPAVDAGDEMAQAISDWIGHAVRLVRVGDSAHQWPKVNPVHSVSDKSHAALNARLADEGKPLVEIERFRPNVIFSAERAWQEEESDCIDLGETRLILKEASVRCVLPNISRETAEVAREPLYTIAKLSRERTTGRKASFGIYSRAEGSRLAVGMAEPGQAIIPPRRGSAPPASVCRFRRCDRWPGSPRS
ncbi:MOSC domain-containing protein [Oceaniglobus trochenteri]|uniref:MOSC domain-containing protein n=1 Tax=Oceaniglobus trochenteri TaxID=2763260 RepID=UPI001CFF7FF4|nr:MOSC N-terminal beta barrel domain-containing protein [Oceaniglobus trochenteri]